MQIVGFDKLPLPADVLTVITAEQYNKAKAAKKPEVVLADEPTGSLDPKNKAQVVNLLRTMCSEQGSTLILVSHEENVIERFENRVRFADINRAYETEVVR